MTKCVLLEFKYSIQSKQIVGILQCFFNINLDAVVFYCYSYLLTFSGVEARSLLVQSGLPQPVLAQIW